MTVTVRQAAEAVRAHVHQQRSLFVVGELLDQVASLENLEKEAKAATEKALKERDTVNASIEKEKAAVAAQVRAAQDALDKAKSDLAETIEANKAATDEGKKIIAEQKRTITAREKEIADLDERLAAAQKKVAAFLAK